MEQIGFFQRVQQELRLRNYSPKTIKAYTGALRSLVRHFHPRHPRDLTREELKTYLLYLLEVRRFSAGTVGQVVAVLRFLYAGLYHTPQVVEDRHASERGVLLPVDGRDVFCDEEDVAHSLIGMVVGTKQHTQHFVKSEVNYCA